MRVAKWGNSLAVRLPASIVEEMGLREGDDVDLIFNSKSDIEIARNRRREEALARIADANWKLPEGWKFDRDEANSR